MFNGLWDSKDDLVGALEEVEGSGDSPVTTPAARVLTALVLMAINAVLLAVLKPRRRELRSVLVASTVAATADHLFERGMGRLGVWNYDLPCSVKGLPVDLFPDFFMVCSAFLMGIVACERSANRRARALYIVAVSLGLGTEAYLKNRSAALGGRISFGGLDPRGPLFMAGNYLVMYGVVLLLRTLYSFVSKRMS